MFNKLFNPERLKDETQDDYKARRKLANETAKSVRKGIYPTNFFQWNPHQLARRRNNNAL